MRNSYERVQWIWIIVGAILAVGLIYVSSTNKGLLKQRDLKNIQELIEGFGNNLKNVELVAPQEIREEEIEKYYKGYLTKELLERLKINPEGIGKQTSSPWPEKIEITSLIFLSPDKAEINGEIIEMTSSGESGRRKIILEITLVDKFLRKWLISDIKIEDQVSEKENLSLANPAAVFCKEMGYRYEIRQDPKGNQYGVCIFDDNTECEEWAFYRKECGVSYLKGE